MENIIGKRKSKLLRSIKRSLGGWLLLLPSLALFAFFIFIPTIQNIYLSFFDTVGGQSVFVEFSNFRGVFNDPMFMHALTNTLWYVLWSIVIGFFIPIIIGLFLSELKHCKTFVKVAVYIPTVIPAISMVIMFVIFFGASDYSTANIVLRAFGISPNRWFNSPDLVRPMIILTLTWRGMGATALIYLATFLNVDQSLYEAASLDGAGPFKRIWHVSLPSIKGMIRMLFIMQIIAVFQILFEPMVFGRGHYSSISLMQLIHAYAFRSNEHVSRDPGRASALGVMLTFLLFGVSIIYMYATRGPKEEKEKRRNKHANKEKSIAKMA